MKTPPYQDSKESCPQWGVDLQGKPIPEDEQHLFGATHFNRKIGIYDMNEDRTTHYRCPDCDHMWERGAQNIAESERK